MGVGTQSGPPNAWLDPGAGLALQRRRMHVRSLTLLEVSEISGGNKLVVEFLKWVAGSVGWDIATSGEQQDSQKFIVDEPSASSAVRG